MNLSRSCSSWEQGHLALLSQIIFSRTFIHQTTLEGRDSVSPQNKDQVCLQSWRIEVVPLPGAKSRGFLSSESPRKMQPTIDGSEGITSALYVTLWELGLRKLAGKQILIFWLLLLLWVIKSLVSDPGVYIFCLQPLKDGDLLIYKGRKILAPHSPWQSCC